MKILAHICDSRYATFDLLVDGLRVEVGGQIYEIRDKKGEMEVSSVNSKRGITIVPMSQGTVRLVDREAAGACDG